MGLFDFAKDMGRKLFNTDAEAADRIKETLDITLTPIKGLEVEYDDGVVTLCGDCPDSGTRELAILTAGNVQGVTQVIADELKSPPAPPQEKYEYYVVQSGDSLSAIAKRYYSDAMQYPKIFEANKDMIKDADKIYPGQKIRIPV
jgi:nucleoid-associated protein YgaU